MPRLPTRQEGGADGEAEPEPGPATPLKRTTESRPGGRNPRVTGSPWKTARGQGPVSPGASPRRVRGNLTAQDAWRPKSRPLLPDRQIAACGRFELRGTASGRFPIRIGTTGRIAGTARCQVGRGGKSATRPTGPCESVLGGTPPSGRIPPAVEEPPGSFLECRKDPVRRGAESGAAVNHSPKDTEAWAI